MDEQKWESIGEKPPFNCLVTDLSFISLTKIIPTAAKWLVKNGWWIMLVKPQFELDPSKTPGGIVKNPEHRQEALNKVLEVIKEQPNLVYKGVMPSPITGADGNQEFLMWVEGL